MIAALAVVVVVWMINPSGDTAKIIEDLDADVVQSPAATDGFVEQPTGPAVPVTLPEVEMTNVPVETPEP